MLARMAFSNDARSPNGWSMSSPTSSAGAHRRERSFIHNVMAHVHAKAGQYAPLCRVSEVQDAPRPTAHIMMHVQRGLAQRHVMSGPLEVRAQPEACRLRGRGNGSGVRTQLHASIHAVLQPCQAFINDQPIK